MTGNESRKGWQFSTMFWDAEIYPAAISLFRSVFPILAVSHTLRRRISVQL